MSVHLNSYPNYATPKKDASDKEHKIASLDERKAHPWRQQISQRLETLKQLLNIPDLDLQIKQLILIPHRDLHCLPLHTLLTQPVTYLPSLQVGLNLLDRPDTGRIQTSDRFFSLETQSRDLLFAFVESEVITRLFTHPSTRINATASTTGDIVRTLETPHHLFHYTGHGSYDTRQPQNSALRFNEIHHLTAQHITQRPLIPYALVCLSACETAITGRQTLETEYVGIVSAFLKAGAAQVVSTLWTVEEESNAWLIIYFYQLLLKGIAPAIALPQAQIWLHTVQTVDLHKLASRLKPAQ